MSSGPYLFILEAVALSAATWPLAIASNISKKGLNTGTLVVGGAAAAGAYGAVRLFPQYNKFLMIYAGGAVGFAVLEALLLAGFINVLESKE